MSMDYYAILGVARTVSGAQIKEAFLRLARENHPDRFRDPEARARAESHFQQVNEAFNHLKDDKLRQEYDRQLLRQAMTPAQEAELYYKNGRLREQVADDGEALKFYYEAMRLDPETARYIVAAARLVAKDPAKARQAAELYEKALAKDPLDIAPYLELGDLFMQARLPTRARRVYESGLQHHPGDPELRSRLASTGGKK